MICRAEKSAGAPERGCFCLEIEKRPEGAGAQTVFNRISSLYRCAVCPLVFRMNDKRPGHTTEALVSIE